MNTTTLHPVALTKNKTTQKSTLLWRLLIRKARISKSEFLWHGALVSECSSLHNMIVDILVGVCYRPPKQEGALGDRTLQTNRSSFVFTGSGPHGGFSHVNVFLMDNVEKHKQSRRFLEHVGDNFLLQVIWRKVLCWILFSPTRRRRGGCKGQGQPGLQWP